MSGVKERLEETEISNKLISVLVAFLFVIGVTMALFGMGPAAYVGLVILTIGVKVSLKIEKLVTVLSYKKE